MANIRKTFNFRNGVQVDDDNLVVNSNGLVGIGTSVPTETFDVRGTAKVVGVVTTNDLFTNSLIVGFTSTGQLGIATINGGLEVGTVSVSPTGIITATSGVVTYYGDGGRLLNLPTSQWLDVDIGLGFTSIYAQGFVGVGTNSPIYPFQVAGSAQNATFGSVGATGVGIDSTGNIYSTGIVTALSYYGIGVGLTNLNASSILGGTLDTNRLPSNIKVSGIVSATTFVGSLTGVASTASSLIGSPNITVTDITATSLGVTTVTAALVDSTRVEADTLTAGVSTTTNTLHVASDGTGFSALSSGRIGVGTAVPTSELQIRKSSGSLLEVVSESGESKISLGQLVGAGNSTGVLRFGNQDKTLDLINNDTGNINTILHSGSSGVGTGRFDWIYGQTNAELMSLTYDGKLGIGKTNPDNDLHVVGTSTVTGDAFIGGDLTVSGNIAGTLTLPNVFEGNVNGTSGISTFATISVTNLGVGTDSPISDLDARSSTGLFAAIGIGTTTFYGSEVLSVVGSVTIPDGGVGIGTTYLDPAGASLQLFSPLIDLNEGHLNIKSDSSVGFDTSDPKAIFDFSNVGSATTRPVMVVPNINNATITGIAQTPAGSIIFNTTTLKFQGYTGIAWTDFH